MNLASTLKFPGRTPGNLAFTGSLFLHLGFIALFSSWQWEWKVIDKNPPETIRVKFLSTHSSSRSTETSNSPKPSPRVPARPRPMQPNFKSLFMPRTPNSFTPTLQSKDVVHQMVRSHRKIIKRSLSRPTSNAINKLFSAKAPAISAHHNQPTVTHRRPPALEVQASNSPDTPTRTAIATEQDQPKLDRIRRLHSPDQASTLSQVDFSSHAGAEQPTQPRTSGQQFSALPRDLRQSILEEGEAQNADPNALRGLFIGQVRQRVANAKYYPRIARRRGMEGQPVIAFTLNKNGRLMKVDLARTSGYQLLDQAALEAVQQGAPYPEIPAELKIDTFQFKLPISFAFK
jgi:TonB family protein